jgi:hypothetical protein
LYVRTFGDPPAVESNCSTTSDEEFVVPIKLIDGGDVRLPVLVDPENVSFHVASAFGLVDMRRALCGAGAPLVTTDTVAVTPDGHDEAVTSVKLPEMPKFCGSEICDVAPAATDAVVGPVTEGTVPPEQPANSTRRTAAAKPAAPRM